MRHGSLGKMRLVAGTKGGLAPDCTAGVHLTFKYMHDLVNEIAVTEAARLTTPQAGIELTDCRRYQR